MLNQIKWISHFCSSLCQAMYCIDEVITCAIFSILTLNHDSLKVSAKKKTMFVPFIFYLQLVGVNSCLFIFLY